MGEKLVCILQPGMYLIGIKTHNKASKDTCANAVNTRASVMRCS